MESLLILAISISLRFTGGWEGEFLAQPQNQMPEDFREFEAVYAQHGGKADFGHFSEQDWAAQFQAVEQTMDKGKGKAVDWEEEFAKTEGLEDREFVERFNEAWKASAGEFDELSGAATSGTKSWEDDYDDYLNSPGPMNDPDPLTGPLLPYHFEKENPFLNHENPLEEGLRLWNEGGQLSAAALCFEAAVQKEEHNSRGWMYLGQVQAENEKEEPAIAALQRSVREAPDNLPALMVGLRATSGEQTFCRPDQPTLRSLFSPSPSRTPTKDKISKPTALFLAGSRPVTPTSLPKTLCRRQQPCRCRPRNSTAASLSSS